MNSLLKPKLTHAQLVTPTQLKRQETTVMKGAQVQQKTKDGLTEGRIDSKIAFTMCSIYIILNHCAVRDIFSRVEHTFKKRKEEAKMLEIEVSDLERNLEYLENQTQDQIRETAALSLAYVNSKTGIMDVEDSLGKVNQRELAECKELADDVKTSVASGMWLWLFLC